MWVIYEFSAFSLSSADILLFVFACEWQSEVYCFAAVSAVSKWGAKVSWTTETAILVWFRYAAIFFVLHHCKLNIFWTNQAIWKWEILMVNIFLQEMTFYWLNDKLIVWKEFPEWKWFAAIVWLVPVCIYVCMYVS